MRMPDRFEPAAPELSRPLYPQGYAFVVQLRHPIIGTRMAGRVEHMASGRAMIFENADELMAFFREELMDDPPS